MTREELVAGVREHAVRNYNSGGWDVVVECYDDEDIVVAARGSRTLTQAISSIGKIIGVWDERRREVMAEIF